MATTKVKSKKAEADPAAKPAAKPKPKAKPAKAKARSTHVDFDGDPVVPAEDLDVLRMA